MQTIGNRAKELEQILERVESLADIHEISETDFLRLQTLWIDRNDADLRPLFNRFGAIWPKFPEFCRPRSYMAVAA